MKIAIKIIVVSLLTLGAMATIATIGREREPISEPQAKIIVALNMLLIAGVLYL